jgi:AcrR family transcriptional regulator
MAKEEKREAILQATLELLAEQGFHGTPCAMIADRAGVAAGTIYRYFENKDVLINQLYLSLENRITDVLLEDYQYEAPCRERFMHLGTGILRHFISHPLEFKFIEQFHNSPYGAAFMKEKILGDAGGSNIYRALFKHGVDEQVIKNLPLPILFDLAFGPILGVARNHILNFITLDQALIEQVIDACWDSLKR